MAVSNTLLKNTTFAVLVETTEGTNPGSDTAANVVEIRQDGYSTTLGREVLEDDYIRSSLSKGPPQLGMYGDIGFVAPVYLRGSGTQGTAPDYAPLLKCVMGNQFDGTADTVSAGTGTTTGCTVSSGANFIEGGLVRIAVGAGWEYARITNIATNALTWFPPVSAAPADAAAVQPGNAFLLKSDAADFISLSGLFYYEGGKKLVYSGCKGSVTMSLAVGQKVTTDFTMAALNYAITNTAIGYTPNVVSTKPPICLGITYSVLIACTVGAGATTTSIPLTATPDLEIAENGGTTPFFTTQLMVDVGAGVYETKTITAFNQGTQTATTAAYGGAPAEDSVAYVKISECIPQMDIAIEMEAIPSECMSSTYGKNFMVNANRNVTVAFPDYKFTSIYPVEQRDNIVSSEIWAVVGSTAGNIIAINIPKYYPTDVSIDAGDLFMTSPHSGFAALTSGDDEIFITHL